MGLSSVGEAGDGAGDGVGGWLDESDSGDEAVIVS
jgi:hypothetical protein